MSGRPSRDRPGAPSVPRPGSRAGERAAAKARHPTARAWAPDRARMLELLAERARARGARWSRVSAAVLLLRGVSGDERAAFARRVGVSEAELVRLEEGAVPPDGIPARLRAVHGIVDWAWVDGPAGP